MAACRTDRTRGENRTPMLKLQVRGVEVIADSARQDVAPEIESIRYQIIVGTNEPVRQLNLLHDNMQKAATVFNYGISDTRTSTSIPANASLLPTKLPDTGIKSVMSRATATGTRLKPPILRLVGSKLIQPAPGT